MLHTLLLVLALVCFGLACWQFASPIWNRLIALGLAAYVLSLLLAGM